MEQTGEDDSKNRRKRISRDPKRINTLEEDPGDHDTIGKRSLANQRWNKAVDWTMTVSRRSKWQEILRTQEADESDGPEVCQPSSHRVVLLAALLLSAVNGRAITGEVIKLATITLPVIFLRERKGMTGFDIQHFGKRLVDEPTDLVISPSGQPRYGTQHCRSETATFRVK
ncbi:hypothetical protein J6590_032291 [Homalodisca vitripennis]|nr:hypothetical protein J6590_032291 [Homalodisca vitripennis]